MIVKAVKEYFQTGGFPEVQNIDPNIKTEILQGYIDTVFLKDVIEQHQVNNITAIKHPGRTEHTFFVHMYKIHANILYEHTKYLTLSCFALQYKYEFKAQISN